MERPRGLYGLLAEFDTGEALRRAAHAAREAGYQRIDGYSPLHVEGLDEALGFRPRFLPYLVFLGGLGGAAGAYFMQYYASVIHYPILVAGRPLHSWPSFIPLTFEMAVLGASLTALVSLLIANRLPEPHHPLFNVPAFERASQDRFFLCIEASDLRFDPIETRRFLSELGALAVHPVKH